MILAVKGYHCFPRIYMTYYHMRWNRNCFIEKAFLKNFCQILLVFYCSWKFIIMKRNLISFNEIIVEMNRQYLRILYWFIVFFRKILMINVFLGLICFIIGAFWNCSVTGSTSMTRSCSISWSLLLRTSWLFFGSCFWWCFLSFLINWWNLNPCLRINLGIQLIIIWINSCIGLSRLNLLLNLLKLLLLK